jgi:hypothetical protein
MDTRMGTRMGTPRRPWSQPQRTRRNRHDRPDLYEFWSPTHTRALHHCTLCIAIISPLSRALCIVAAFIELRTAAPRQAHGRRVVGATARPFPTPRHARPLLSLPLKGRIDTVNGLGECLIMVLAASASGGLEAFIADNSR